MSFPVDWVRGRFPALADGEVLMDNAGGAQVPIDVIERISGYLINRNVQLGASYRRSAWAGEAVAEARSALATLLGATDPDEIVIGDSTTGLLARLARALRPGWRDGDEVIVSEIDHESNIGPWMRLTESGITVKVWRVRQDPVCLNLADLEELLSPRTRLVAVTQCSNILGSELPVPDIAARVHAVGAELCVDAVGWAAHRLPDVTRLGAHWYVLSLYKVFGPHLAVLWGHHEGLLRARNQNHFFFSEDALPYKLQPGGINYELTTGASGIVAYLAELGTRCGAHEGGIRERLAAAFTGIEEHEAGLSARLLEFLAGREGVRVVGDPHPHPGRLPIISFTVDGVRSSTIPPYLDALGIGIRWGDFYARRLIDALGLGPQDGVVRVSLAHYNTHTEMDRLLNGLEGALE